MRPILHAANQPVFHRIEMNVIGVAREVALVAQRMLPIAALPDATLALAAATLGNPFPLQFVGWAKAKSSRRPSPLLRLPSRLWPLAHPTLALVGRFARRSAAPVDTAAKLGFDDRAITTQGGPACSVTS